MSDPLYLLQMKINNLDDKKPAAKKEHYVNFLKVTKHSTKKKQMSLISQVWICIKVTSKLKI